MSSTTRIRILPDLLIKKIAAGEVVERPASVVKELLENAIDAGATRISLTIEDGGKQLIRVTDDGIGMSPEELRLAVTPHATSKIITEEDLYSILTMGFRGEALASISSVSKLRIASRQADSTQGHEIVVVADQVESSQVAGGAVGTTVEVRDLFFNVPARLKFLRAPGTEVGHINEQLARVSLSHPQIAFELTNNRRVTQNLPGCRTRLERIAKFYGPELAGALMHIERDEGGLRLEIYAAPPAQSRATGQWQYTFVNGRYIRDRFVQHAIKEAYRGLIEPNRHGVVFLFITIDPHKVDVNVHPTKNEVRWAESNLIHSQVLSALRETFQRCDLTPNLDTGRAQTRISESEQERLRQEMADTMKAATPIRPSSGQGAPDTFGERPPGSGSLDLTDRSRQAWSPSSDPTQSWRSLYGPPETPSGQRATADKNAGRASFVEPGPSPSPPRAIQVHNLYLVAETADGIIIVDQHALHERVIYEQLRERITEGPLESQRLLLPETFKVTARQSAAIEANAQLLARLGIEVTPFGTDAVAVHAFPGLLKDTDVVSFMSDLLDQLDQQAGQTTSDVVLNDLLSMMACKAAVKAGDPLSQEEIDALFRRRELIDKSSNCPHGRPTMLRFTKADLERQFKRT